MDVIIAITPVNVGAMYHKIPRFSAAQEPGFHCWQQICVMVQWPAASEQDLTSAKIAHSG